MSFGSERVSETQIPEVKRLYNNLVNFDSGTQEKLQIAIDRWIKSKENQDEVSRIIDLGIAFESLYLPKGNREQLSFQFRLRASRHLGTDKSDREMLMDEFKAIYSLRSKAAHNGKIPRTFKIRKGESIHISKFIRKAQDLCRDSIMKILEKGKFPDWNDLILG
ncbi:hypothetical protein F4X10_00805 [Candidatus Poribacteria bacterium]|nr:hypothetical protein [Candidatus Poribacteria bacterium]